MRCQRSRALSEVLRDGRFFAFLASGGFGIASLVAESLPSPPHGHVCCCPSVWLVATSLKSPSAFPSPAPCVCCVSSLKALTVGFRVHRGDQGCSLYLGILNRNASAETSPPFYSKLGDIHRFLELPFGDPSFSDNEEQRTGAGCDRPHDGVF